MRRRLFAAVLAACLLLSGCRREWVAVTASPPASATAQGTARPSKSGVTLGAWEPLTGDLSGLWGAGDGDELTLRLTRGLATVAVTPEGNFQFDRTVLSAVEVEENPDGSRTADFTLSGELYWSNGEKITARDYAAGVLFWCSPVVWERTERGAAYLALRGGASFAAGESAVFTGVRLLGEDRFSLTLESPGFFEEEHFRVWPLYLKNLLPQDVEVSDGGSGCALSRPFSPEELEQRDTVCAGPYAPGRFQDGAWTLNVNPFYPGDFQGKRPAIETVTVRQADPETAVGELAGGKLDLLCQVRDLPLLEQSGEHREEGSVQARLYPRTGYGHLSMNGERGPTKDLSVRRALLELTDREELSQLLFGELAATPTGPFGPGRREAERVALTPPETVKNQVKAAIDLLAADGWVLNAEGGPYKSGGVRYKETAEGLLPLKLRWASPRESDVAAALEAVWGSRISAAGMEVERVDLPLEAVYGSYLGSLATDYDLYTLATDFESPAYAPYATFRKSERLEALASGLLRSPFGDEEAYLSRFQAFAEAWWEELPAIPLYSNQYCDLLSSRLQGYDPAPNWGAECALLYAWVK